MSEIERAIPHSIEAESGVLGCIFLSPNECMAECVSKFKNGSEVFYDLRNQTIYEAMEKMFEAKEAIDVVTVQQHLKDQKQLDEVGGIAYLADLPDVVPSAANLSFYLNIVLEKYVLRKMILHCTEFPNMVYQHDGDLGQLVEEFEASAMSVAGSILSDTEVTVKDLVLKRIDFYEECEKRGGGLLGLSTGFPDLDRMIDGLKPAEMIVLAARPSVGKAQPLWAQVLTPSGFQSMWEICAGDLVIGLDGFPKKVLGVYPQGVKPVYRVTISDGSVTHCCNDHLWLTQTRNDRRAGRDFSTKTTESIAATIHRADGGTFNHALPILSQVEFSPRQKSLPMHPWLLGALIGDGKLGDTSVCFFKPEPDVQEKVISMLPTSDAAIPIHGGLRIKRKTRSNQPSETKKVIESLGLNVLSHEKFIPHDYLFGSPETRNEVLRGLIDTDGSVTGTSIEYSTSSPQLAQDVLFLIRSLGVMCKINSRIPRYSYLGKSLNGKKSWRIHIVAHESFCSSRKHLVKIKTASRRFHRNIASVEPVGDHQCQCLSVEGGMYVTDDFIPTHNTSLAMNIAENLAIDQKIPVGIFSLEMSREALVGRMISSRSRVNERKLTGGSTNEQEKKAVFVNGVKVGQAPIFIDDTGGMTITQLRAKARRMVQKHKIKLIVIDYMQLLRTAKRRTTQREEMDEVSKGVKAMAKELHLPVIAICQLNRELEKERDRKPRVSDLRESGQIEQDADIIGMLYCTDPEALAAGKDILPVNLLIAKSRNGPCGDVAYSFFKEFTRFESATKWAPKHEEMPKGWSAQPKQEKLI